MEGTRMILASASPRRRELLEQIGLDFEVRVSKVKEIVTAVEPGLVVEELSAQKAWAVLEELEDGERDVLVIGADTVVSADGQILGKPSDERNAAEMLGRLAGRSHEVYTGVTLLYRCGKRGACSEEGMREPEEGSVSMPGRENLRTGGGKGMRGPEEGGAFVPGRENVRTGGEEGMREPEEGGASVPGRENVRTGGGKDLCGAADMDAPRQMGQVWRRTFHEVTRVEFYLMTGEEITRYVASGDCMDKAGAYGIQGMCARYIKGIEGDYNNVVGLPVGRLYQEIKLSPAVVQKHI